MATPILSQLGQQPDETIDWKCCILCQQKGGQLVLNPRLDSYDVLLPLVSERASMNDGEYIEIHGRLQNCTADTLKSNKAVWHRKCYSATTNKVHLQRARDRYQRSLLKGSHIPKERGRPSSIEDGRTSSDASVSTRFTRSATKPLKKDLCFFCQEAAAADDDDEKLLFSVRTDSAGKSLRKAVMISSDPELRTRLATSISDDDAHAIDVKYHKECWRKNVFHVLRDEAHTRERTGIKGCELQAVSLIELLNVIDVQTRMGAYLSMADIDNTYVNMLGGAEVLPNHKPTYNRHWLKEKILSELPAVKHVLQANRRKPGVLYCPDACEAEMVQCAIADDTTDDMKALYRAAQLLRQCIENFQKKESPDNPVSVSSTVEDVPVEVYTLMRWIIAGPADDLETEVRTHVVDQAALTLSQNLMYAFKSKRQVKYQPKSEQAGFRL